MITDCCICSFQTITDAMCKFLHEAGLSLNQCVGVGTDGASVLCGCNNSVLTKLQEKNPSIVGVRYVKRHVNSMLILLYH